MRHLPAGLLMLIGWLNVSHFLPWVSWHSEFPFFLLPWLAAVWWLRRPRRQVEFPMPILVVAVLGLVLWMQGLVGLIFWRGQVLVLTLYLLLIGSAVTWGWREGHFAADETSPPAQQHAGEWLAWSVIVGGMLSLGIALVQVFQVWEDLTTIVRQPYIRRPGGNLGQPNHLATLLVMGMSGVAFLHARGRVGAPTMATLLLFLTGGIAVTESRSGLLATLVLCSLWAWKRPSATLPMSRTWALLPALVVVAIFALWPVFYRWWSGGFDGEAGIGRLESSGSDPRWLLWRQMFEASLLKPWFGWGMRNTAEAHNAIAHEGANALAATYSHNIILDLAVWIGWPMALVVICTIVWWIWSRLKVMNDCPLTWFGMALLVPFGVHSLFEFPFAYAYLLLPAMLGVGFLSAQNNSGVVIFRVPRWTLSLVIAVAGLLGAWSMVDYFRVEEDFRVARFQMLRIGPSPTEPPPKIWLLNQLSDLVASTRVPLQQGLSAAQVDLLRRAALHYPWSGSQYRYATALALNGAPDEARRQLQVLRAQQGFKIYRPLAAQLEQDLAKRGLPILGVPLEKPQ
jgi:hypothetical protein